MTAAITAQSLVKYFPKMGRLPLRALLTGLPEEERFTALEDISFEVPHGEVVGVLGRNGAGKSTLLRVVGGIHSPDKGSVALTGDVAGLFELGGFGNTQLTGREFAQRYLQLFGVPRQNWSEVLADIGEFSELGEYFDEKILTYSAGMGARLYFAAATAVPHEIYLIDEILSVGDEHFQTKSWARIRERLAHGASGLLVTHDWSAVIKLCRESKVLDAGKVVLQGRSDVVVAGYLDLATPVADRARIHPPSPHDLEARACEDFELRFRVELVDSVPTEVCLSIEALQLGVGWEPVILPEYVPIGSQPGIYEVCLRVPALPLAAGDYSLNLFLATPPDPSTGARIVLDTRGWTYGTGLVLRVTDGCGDGGISPFPVRWLEEAV